MKGCLVKCKECGKQLSLSCEYEVCKKCRKAFTLKKFNEALKLIWEAQK